MKDPRDTSKPKVDQGGDIGPEPSCDGVTTICEIRAQEAALPPNFIERVESQESQPGAFAIAGIEPPSLRRQERIHMRRVPSPARPELLINAVVVDEEQPSLVFEASPLTIHKSNGKWFIAITLLISLLVCSIAVGVFQASVHSKVRSDGAPSKLVANDTSENATPIKSQPSTPTVNISSTPPEISPPSISPVLRVA